MRVEGQPRDVAAPKPGGEHGSFPAAMSGAHPRPARSRAWAWLACAGIALTAGCMSLEPQVPKLVTADHSGPVVLAKGDTLVVALASTPADRGHWVAQPSDAAVLRQIGAVDLLPGEVAPGTVGQPGDSVYRFRAAEVGSASLEFLRRDGAGNAQAAAPLHLDVTVAPRPGPFAEAWAKSR